MQSSESTTHLEDISIEHMQEVKCWQFVWPGGGWKQKGPVAVLRLSRWSAIAASWQWSLLLEIPLWMILGTSQASPARLPPLEELWRSVGQKKNSMINVWTCSKEWSLPYDVSGRSATSEDRGDYRYQLLDLCPSLRMVDGEELGLQLDPVTCERKSFWSSWCPKNSTRTKTLT